MNDKDELLKQLRDVELPEVSSTPALGWWLLLLLLLLMLFAAFIYYRRWQSTLWQRQAKSQLSQLRAQLGKQPSDVLLAKSSELVRKVVLAADEREQVAALHGEAWIEKLDAICDRPEFSQGIGRLIVDQPYKKQPVVGKQDLTALFDSMDVLISKATSYKPTRTGIDVDKVST